MTAYLIDHPPRRTQFKERGTTVSGVLEVHTAESGADTIGPDTGAENVARFIQQRSDPGSYHWLGDSDSLLDVIPMHLQAYGDGTGLNPHAIHISAATQAAKWATLPKSWTEPTVENMALAAHRSSSYVFEVHGVRVPARFISRAEAGRRVEGFIAHGTSDPGRRYDPGKDFPWPVFFEAYRDFESPDLRPSKPRPTRGAQVDLALRKTSAAITALEKATGGGRRAEKLDAAEVELRQARRALRDMSILNAGGDAS